MTDGKTQPELITGLMTLPIEGLKMICIINGGAAIAVLTYLGQATSLPAEAIAHLLQSVVWFCAGLSAAAFDLVWAYFVQLAYVYSLWHERQKFAKASRVSRWLTYLYLVLIAIGSLIAVSSVVGFVGGSIVAANALPAIQATQAKLHKSVQPPH